ncbi:15535_t:CDS:1, partial [Acaulospora colombiana]
PVKDMKSDLLNLHAAVHLKMNAFETPTDRIYLAMFRNRGPGHFEGNYMAGSFLS